MRNVQVKNYSLWSSFVILIHVQTFILWGSCVTFVQQINIPKQTEHVHWLTFSPVEDHFYRRQYTISIQDSMKVIVKKSYLTFRVYGVSFNPWMLFLGSHFWFLLQRLDKWRDPTIKLSSLDRATANQVRPLSLFMDFLQHDWCLNNSPVALFWSEMLKKNVCTCVLKKVQCV